MKLIKSWNRENIAEIGSLFHTANGYLDVPNGPEEGPLPGCGRGALICCARGKLPAPDAQTVRLVLNGRAFSMFPEETADREQAADPQTGLVTRACVWMHPDGAVRLLFTRMASLEIPNLFLLRLCAESYDYDGTIAIESTVGGPEKEQGTLLFSGIEEDEASVVCRALPGEPAVCCRAMQGCSLPGGWEGTGACLSGHFEGRLRPGERVKLNKLAVYATGATGESAAAEARRVMREARQLGGSELIRRQKKILAGEPAGPEIAESAV